MKKYHTSSQHKKAGMTTLILDKVGFKIKPTPDIKLVPS